MMLVECIALTYEINGKQYECFPIVDKKFISFIKDNNLTELSGELRLENGQPVIRIPFDQTNAS